MMRQVFLPSPHIAFAQYLCRPLPPTPARLLRRRATAPLAFVLAGLFSGGAWAERITFEPSGDATGNIIGHVVIENDEGSNTNTRIIELPGYGELTIQYFTTLNEVTPSGLCCADEVRILDLPEGVLPDAWETTVEENSTATITLYRYVGG